MRTSYQLVRVFNKAEEAQGNQAVVFFKDSQIDLPHELSGISAEIYKQKGVATTCFISQVVSGHYKVQCFTGNKAIQCCGHGMIAAAKTIFSYDGLSSIIINENVTASQNIDEAGCDVVVLELPRLLARSQAVPGWVNEAIAFDRAKLLPGKAAVSEKNDGYLLLEFEPTLPLDVFRALQLDLKLVCENTKRAIVLVQFDQENEHLYTRYFSPQYGVLEDIATGSVMRFVGDYIEQNYQLAHFDVSQCSSQGGFMKINCQAERILITANATIESN